MALKKKSRAAVSKTKAVAKPRSVTKARAKSLSQSTKTAKPGAALDFNHAMIYARDVGVAADFYARRLGFKLIEDFKHEGRSVYARLRSPGGSGTIALHQAAPGAPVTSDGVRLYFEIPELDAMFDRLQRAGIYFTQPPRMMPWGWRHAYLDDPDGHEISLYWAGENRMQKTVMQAAKEASRRPRAKRPR